jgi:hypothetical protein
VNELGKIFGDGIWIELARRSITHWRVIDQNVRAFEHARQH